MGYHLKLITLKKILNIFELILVDGTNPSVLTRQSVRNLPGPVLAPVINDDNFIIVSHLGENGLEVKRSYFACSSHRFDSDSAFFIEDLSFSHYTLDERVAGSNHSPEFIRSIKKDVDAKSRPDNPDDLFNPVQEPLSSLLDNQQVEVAVLIRRSLGIRPEQDHLLGMIRLEQPQYSLDF
jgi:hypothetical protein